METTLDALSHMWYFLIKWIELAKAKKEKNPYYFDELTDVLVY